MVEIGNLQIGGSIQTAEIERGIKRIDTGLKDISNSGKSVGSDFERIAAQGKRMTTIFGTLAVAGTAALTAWVKDTPAVAGSMARINLSLLKLKMSAGEALAPVFDAAADGLNKLSNWANEHPDVFAGITKSVVGVGIATVAIKVGGWIYSAWSGFFGLFKGMATWGGWSTIGTAVKNVSTKIGGFFSSAISWFTKIPGALKSFLFGGGAVSAGVTGGLATGASAGGMMLGPLINTYVKDENGQGFLDRQMQEYYNSDYYKNQQFQEQMKMYSRNGGELEAQYFL